MADSIQAAGESGERINGDGGSVVVKKQQQRDGAPMQYHMTPSLLEATIGAASMISQQISPITVSAPGGLEIAEDKDIELGIIHVVPNNSEISETGVIQLQNDAASLVDPSEGGTDGDSNVNIDQERGIVHTQGNVGIQLIAHGNKAVGAYTVAAAVHSFHSKPASGVVFNHNKLAYDGTLAIIFAFGVAQFFTAIWIAKSGSLTYRHRSWIGGIVLFLSIWLLVGIYVAGFA